MICSICNKKEIHILMNRIPKNFKVVCKVCKDALKGDPEG